MRIHNDYRVDKIIRNLSVKDQGDIIGVIQLLRDKEFTLTREHLKKLTRNIWELRTKRYRLLFGMIEHEAIIVSIFYKKTQKTPKREIELAIKRLKTYI